MEVLFQIRFHTQTLPNFIKIDAINFSEIYSSIRVQTFTGGV